MKKWLMLSILALGVLLGASKPAHAGPDVWTFTCDPWSAFIGGVVNFYGSPWYQIKTHCWYEAYYMGSTIIAGDDQYYIPVPVSFVKKHGIATSVETYQGSAVLE